MYSLLNKSGSTCQGKGLDVIFFDAKVAHSAIVYTLTVVKARSQFARW